MALPSQTERTAEMSRPVMTRTGGQGGPPNKIVLGVVTLVLAAGAIYGIMRLLPSGSTGPNKAEAKTAQRPTVPAPKSIAPPPPTTPTQPADNPVVLSQGKGSTDAGPTGLNRPS